MKTIPTSLFREDLSQVRSNPRMCPQCDSEELKNGECWECGYKERSGSQTSGSLPSKKLEVKDVHRDTFVDSRIMILKYSGYCVFCGRSIKSGKRAYYFPQILDKSGTVIRSRVISCLDHEREYRISNAKFDFVVGDKVQYDGQMVTILEVDKSLGTYKVLLPDGNGMILQTTQVKEIPKVTELVQVPVEVSSKIIDDNSTIDEIISTMKDEPSIDLALDILDKKIEQIAVYTSEKKDLNLKTYIIEKPSGKYILSELDFNDRVSGILQMSYRIEYDGDVSLIYGNDIEKSYDINKKKYNFFINVGRYGNVAKKVLNRFFKGAEKDVKIEISSELGEELKLREKQRFEDFMNKTNLKIVTRWEIIKNDNDGFITHSFIPENFTYAEYTRNKKVSKIKYILDKKLEMTPFGNKKYLENDEVEKIVSEEMKLIENKEEKINKKIEEEKIIKLEKFKLAKETNIPQLLSQFTDSCNDPKKECDIDIIAIFAMPDGTEKTTRTHTY